MIVVRKLDYIAYVFLDGVGIPSHLDDTIIPVDSNKKVFTEDIDMVFVFRDEDRDMNEMTDTILFHDSSGTVIRVHDFPIWISSQESLSLTFDDIAMIYDNVDFGTGKYELDRIYSTDDYPISFFKFKHMIHRQANYYTIFCDDKADYLEMKVSR